MDDRERGNAIAQWIFDFIGRWGSWTFLDYALLFGVLLAVALVVVLVIQAARWCWRRLFPKLEQNKRKQFTTKGLKRRWR